MDEHGTMSGLIAIAIGLGCLLMIFYPIAVFVKRRRIDTSGLSTTGTVIRTWRYRRTDGPDDHWAEAAYTNRWGQQKTVKFNGRFREGDQVEVKYDERGGYVPFFGRGRQSSAPSGCSGCLGTLLFIGLIIAAVALIPDLRAGFEEFFGQLTSSP
jgi:hypothetical protein